MVLRRQLVLGAAAIGLFACARRESVGESGVARAAEPAPAGTIGAGAANDVAPPIPLGQFGAFEPLAPLTPAEWRKKLTPDQFAVLREHATEYAYTHALNNEKRRGIYACAGCGLELFTSDAKYDSGTGWPSFWDFIPGRLGTQADFTLWVPRTEYHCIRCEGHQGHVFEDGPPPTGLRYCNNGTALTFTPVPA